MIKRFKGAVVAIVPAAGLMASNAHAALDATIAPALEAVKTDALELGGLVLVVLIAIYGLKLLRKAL